VRAARISVEVRGGKASETMDSSRGQKAPTSMPRHLELAVRFGNSPKDWPDALECYHRAYIAVVDLEGEMQAKRWLRMTIACLIVEGVIRLARDFGSSALF
jgi:hypothetical protein